MSVVIVTDIKQLDVQLRTPDMLRFLECAVALNRLDNKLYYLTDKSGKPTHSLEYGKVRGLNNITGLAAYILTLRKNKKLTQMQLAEYTGVPVSVISKLENSLKGDTEVLNQEMVRRLATFLGFSVQKALLLR